LAGIGVFAGLAAPSPSAPTGPRPRLLGDWLRTRFGIARWLNRLTAGLFVGLGVRLLLGQRR
jgi:threonine/homoserine/homoserine lactone efflux protein